MTTKEKAIYITAELEGKFLKGRFSSSGLEEIEQIINEALQAIE